MTIFEKYSRLIKCQSPTFEAIVHQTPFTLYISICLLRMRRSVILNATIDANKSNGMKINEILMIWIFFAELYCTEVHGLKPIIREHFSLSISDCLLPFFLYSMWKLRGREKKRFFHCILIMIEYVFFLSRFCYSHLISSLFFTISHHFACWPNAIVCITIQWIDWKIFCAVFCCCCCPPLGGQTKTNAVHCIEYQNQ